MKCALCVCDDCDGVDRKCPDARCLYCEYSRECPAKFINLK